MHALGPTEPWNQRPGLGVLPDPSRPSVRVATLQSRCSSECSRPIATPKTRHPITARPERTDFLYIHYDRHKRAWSCEQTPNWSNDPVIASKERAKNNFLDRAYAPRSGTHARAWEREYDPVIASPLVRPSAQFLGSVRVGADHFAARPCSQSVVSRHRDRLLDELYRAVDHCKIRSARVKAAE